MFIILTQFLVRLFFEETKSRYCRHSIVVVDGVVVVVVVIVIVGSKKFNIDHNFYIIIATCMELHTRVCHYQGYNLTKGDNSVRIFDRIMPFMD